MSLFCVFIHQSTGRVDGYSSITYPGTITTRPRATTQNDDKMTSPNGTSLWWASSWWAFVVLVLVLCLWDGYVLPCAVLPWLRLVCGDERAGGAAAAREEEEEETEKETEEETKEDRGGGAGTAAGRRGLFPPPRSVVLVTGAARREGIGFHVARGFLTRGCHVILCDIDGAGLSRAERALDPDGRLTRWRDGGGGGCDSDGLGDGGAVDPDAQFLMSVVCDVSNPDAVRRAKMEMQAAAPMVARLRRQRQRQRQRQRRWQAATYPRKPYQPRVVDILVQNAGVVTGKPLCALTADETRHTLSVNLSAHFYGLREFLPAMIEHDSGFVVTVASMMGHIGGAHLAPYCAAKWGLLGLDECLRMELRRSGTTGVRTMAVCPYVVTTGMFRGAFGGGDGDGDGDGNGNTWWRRASRSVREMLIPALTAESVAKDIVYETLTRRKPTSWHARCTCGARGSVLVLPRRMALAPAALRILPIGVQEWILDLLGGVNGMTGFRGHGGADVVHKRST